jgi:hypothetical protein
VVRSVVTVDKMSEHVLAVLDSMAGAVDHLRSFGYDMYLKYNAPSWTQPSWVFCGQPFHYQARRYAHAMMLGCAIHCDTTANHSITFSLLVAWDANCWSVWSVVEDEDWAREQISETLWESAE